MGKVLFSHVSVCSHMEGGRYNHLTQQWQGVTTSSLMGYSPVGTGWRYPSSALDGVPMQSELNWGTPCLKWMGTPPWGNRAAQ